MTTASVDMIITDLDDTLWKWCKTWHAGFLAFNRTLSEFGVSPKGAENCWARMYERVNGETIEFPPNPDDIARETELSTQHAIEAHRAAVEASRRERDAAFEVFPAVRETLEKLKERGIAVVAHTDSPITAAQHRMWLAGLDGLIDELYARPVFDDFGDGLDLIGTTVSHVSHWTPKPDTTVLREIIRHRRVDPLRTLYVGDSKRRDMSMASAVGLIPVWAAYGIDYPERDPAVADLVKVQCRRPFPPDASLANEQRDPEHVYLSGFDDLIAVLDELPLVQSGGF